MSLNGDGNKRLETHVASTRANEIRNISNQKEKNGDENNIIINDNDVISRSSVVTRNVSNNELVLKTFIQEVSGVYRLHSSSIQNLVQQASIVASFNSKELNRSDVTIKDIWRGLLENVPMEVKSMIALVKDLPGVRGINNTQDLAIIINHHIVDYYLVSLFSSSFLFIDLAFFFF